MVQDTAIAYLRWQTDRSMIYRMVPFSVTLNDS